ncbi:hypothetical protein [Kingella negevensis]|nr:hypothetical protein [Kingella negevensis]
MLLFVNALSAQNTIYTIVIMTDTFSGSLKQGKINPYFSSQNFTFQAA